MLSGTVVSTTSFRVRSKGNFPKTMVNFAVGADGMRSAIPTPSSSPSLDMSPSTFTLATSFYPASGSSFGSSLDTPECSPLPNHAASSILDCVRKRLLRKARLPRWNSPRVSIVRAGSTVVANLMIIQAALISCLLMWLTRVKQRLGYCIRVCRRDSRGPRAQSGRIRVFTKAGSLLVVSVCVRLDLGATSSRLLSFGFVPHFYLGTHRRGNIISPMPQRL